MRWLVRRFGDAQRHLADLPEEGDAAPRDGVTACGIRGRLTPERPVGGLGRDELAAAAMGVCERCLSGLV